MINTHDNLILTHLLFTWSTNLFQATINMCLQTGQGKAPPKKDFFLKSGHHPPTPRIEDSKSDKMGEGGILDPHPPTV